MFIGGNVGEVSSRTESKTKTRAVHTSAGKHWEADAGSVAKSQLELKTNKPILENQGWRR